MKHFGLGLLCGAVLGTVVGYLKNPNTGNTIKQDLKQQIEDTVTDSQNIEINLAKITHDKEYLETDGQKSVTDLVNDITDRIDGYQNQIKPNLNRISEKIESLTSHLEKLNTEE